MIQHEDACQLFDDVVIKGEDTIPLPLFRRIIMTGGYSIPLSLDARKWILHQLLLVKKKRLNKLQFLHLMSQKENDAIEEHASKEPRTADKKLLQLFSLDQLKKSQHSQTVRRLDLSNSQILTVPENILTLTRLKCLCLSQNRLKILPSFIGDLHQLQELDFSHNLIQSLPISFHQLVSLRLVRYHGNPLLEIVQKELKQGYLSCFSFLRACEEVGISLLEVK